MALGIVVVEVIPTLAAHGKDTPVAGDELVLRLGAADAGQVEPSGERETSPTGSTAAEGGVEGVDYHVVLPGETLGSIASLCFGDARRAADLARLNRLADPDTLHPGQVLRLR